MEWRRIIDFNFYDVCCVIPSVFKVKFPAYRADELYDIIKDRVTFAFRHGTIKTELIKMVSYAAQGDARVGLEIMKKAGKKAEVRNLEEVGIRELKEAISEANKLKKLYPIDKLNEHQKIIYKILEKNRKMRSGLLYKKYCSLVSQPVVDRAYRKYMKRLVELGLVKAKGKGRWKRYELVI